MPRHDLELSNRQRAPLELHHPDGLMVHTKNQLRLRQRGPDGVWNPLGTYTTADLLVQVWKPKAVRQLTGFWAVVQEDVAKGDLVRFRLSIADGATPLYWTGSLWRAPADDSEWNTEAEIDAGISSFPFDGSIGFHVKLISGDGTSTPVFHAFYVFWEAFYDPAEDLLRSVHAKLFEEVEISAEDLVDHVDPADEITLVDPLTAPVWVPEEPIQVFNLANDPGRMNDLFASFDGQTVKLASPQTGQLLIRYRGRLHRAHVSTDADVERETLPAVVIHNIAQNRVRDFLLPDYEEPLRSKGVVRIRTMPSRWRYQLQLQCRSQNPLHDKKLADAVQRAFEEKQFVRSQALDEEFVLTARESKTQVNQTDQQLFMRIVLVDVSVWEWPPQYVDVPMAREFVLNREVLTDFDLNVVE